jgi:hypothetical protein
MAIEYLQCFNREVAQFLHEARLEELCGLELARCWLCCGYWDF